MCTRYYVEESPELRPFVEKAAHSSLKEEMVDILGKAFHSFGEIKPTDMTTVIAPSRSGKEAIYPMVWGYTIKGLDRPVVNARVETAKERKSFKEDWLRHRCVIPASWYYEWEHTILPDGRTERGSKYAIQPRGASITYLAGLYHFELCRGLKYPVFTILTRAPSGELARIHDRMPVILPEECIEPWILPNGKPEEVVRKALTDMVAEKA